uniref:ZP domain-containing protein n=1 Tax=Sus scrofa TaxID=9823 RepID=A0A8D0SDQ7_PIG
MTSWGSDATSSTKDPATVGTIECSFTTPAPSNNGRDNSPAAPPNTSLTARRPAPSESQKHATPATPPSSPRPSSSAGSTEQTTSIQETQEERLNTALTTSSESTTLSDSLMTSTLKDQGGTSRSTTSSSMATSAYTSKQNQSVPTTASLPSSSIVSGLESLVSTDSPESAMTTSPIDLNTPGNDVTLLESMTTTVSQKSAPTVSLATLNEITDGKESLFVTTRALTHTTSPTMTTLEITVPRANVSETQEGVTVAASPTPTTAHTMSTLSERHHNTTTQTPSHPEESAPSADTATAQSPEPSVAHSAALIPSSSVTTKSSAMTGASQASPKHTQSSGPQAGVCALDEYPADTGGCMCNDSYYAHSELSRVLVALHCQPQKIEVILSSCFLKTRRWILEEGAFSRCSSVSKIAEGRSVQVFTMEKKDGTCGLHLSTNNSHALYSLEVQLLKVLPDSVSNDSTVLSFKCMYPLVFVVRVSFLSLSRYITIHVPGTGDTIVILAIFTDSAFSSPLENRPAPLGKPLYVVLRATSSDPDRFALVANEVFASTNISRTGAAKATYYFVKKSCPVSNRLLRGVQANGASLEVKLAFNLFRFSTSDTVYLHGRVTLCDKRAGRQCQPTCSQKSPPKSRAWKIPAREGLESGAGWMVFGPIRLGGNEIIWGPP